MHPRLSNRDDLRGGVMIWFFLWLSLSVVVGAAAASRNRSGWGWFLPSLIFSPIITGLLVLALPDLQGQHLRPAVLPAPAAPTRPSKTCPECAEVVPAEARIYRFCRLEFAAPHASPAPPLEAVPATFTEPDVLPEGLFVPHAARSGHAAPPAAAHGIRTLHEAEAGGATRGLKRLSVLPDQTQYEARRLKELAGWGSPLPPIPATFGRLF